MCTTIQYKTILYFHGVLYKLDTTPMTPSVREKVRSAVQDGGLRLRLRLRLRRKSGSSKLLLM
jgi:hypothetical protein